MSKEYLFFEIRHKFVPNWSKNQNIVPQTCCAVRGSYRGKRELVPCRALGAWARCLPLPPMASRGGKSPKTQKSSRNGSPWLENQHNTDQNQYFFEPELMAAAVLVKTMVFDMFFFFSPCLGSLAGIILAGHPNHAPKNVFSWQN